MGLRIIYGRAGSGKSEYIFSEIAKLIEREKKIYIITPEQFSFTAEKKLMDAIKEDAVFNAEVITLSRMAYRIMQEVGKSEKESLSKCGKAMLIYSILSKQKDNLTFLGKSDENIDLSLRAITEFKKHGIKVENLKQEIDKVQDNYLKTKLQDMQIVYENFEKQISSKYIDDTDLLTVLYENLDKTNFVKDSIIYIDEFSGFTYQEYQILKKFIQLAKQVNITITTDNLNKSQNSDTDIFYSNKLTIEKVDKLVRENNLKIEETINLGEPKRFKTKELIHLEKNIYSPKYTKYEQNVENIELFLAKNEYSEIENMAIEINKLVLKNKYKYKDISIITKNIDTYSNLVRSIFAKYDIPVFIDEKRDLNQNSIVQYILSLLEVFTKNFSEESVLAYVKTPYIDIDKDEIYKLENYVIKWGIKHNKWKKDFVYDQNDETKKQEIERLNEIRKQIINPLTELREKIGKRLEAKQIVLELYNFLISQKLDEKVQEKIDLLEVDGRIDVAKEYKESYKIIINILDEIVNIFGEEKVTLEQFAKILKVGLKNSGLGKIPGTSDQVIFGDTDRSRSHKVDIVFIIGLNDGSMPSNNKEEGFLNDSDRMVLKKDGLELAKGTIDKIYEDNFNIYKAFTTAEKKIYLSYASSDSESKSLRPSILLIKLKKIFPNLEEKSDIIQRQTQITNEIATYEDLLENISNLKDGKQIQEIWYVIYKYYEQKNKQKLDSDLKGLCYANIPEQIRVENIDKLYGKTLNTSVSKLERYRSCAFSYYLQYGLKLKEKEELKVQSFNTGSFMHEVIDEFFEYVKDNKILLTGIEEEQIKQIVSKIIGEKLKLTKNYIFVATAKYKLLVKRLERLVVKALKYIIESLIYSDFNIEQTELEFATNSKYKPIVIQLENGKKVELTGKIDRIDTAKDSEGKYLRIIDYKSSAKNIDLNEVYAGMQIQLLTYLDAVCKQEDFIPAGVLYFSLIEQIVKADKKMDEEEIENLIRKKFKMKGLILADVKVIKMQDRNLESGTSSVIPAGITKQGSILKKSTNGVNREEFKILQDYIYVTIKQIAKEILNGKIEMKPYNKKGKTPCEYCSYKTICGFDPQLEENNYNFISKKTNDDIILKMKKQMEEV